MIISSLLNNPDSKSTSIFLSKYVDNVCNYMGEFYLTCRIHTQPSVLSKTHKTHLLTPTQVKDQVNMKKEEIKIKCSTLRARFVMSFVYKFCFLVLETSFLFFNSFVKNSNKLCFMFSNKLKTEPKKKFSTKFYNSFLNENINMC